MRVTPALTVAPALEAQEVTLEIPALPATPEITAAAATAAPVGQVIQGRVILGPQGAGVRVIRELPVRQVLALRLVVLVVPATRVQMEMQETPVL
jgi:hypothetical protein